MKNGLMGKYIRVNLTDKTVNIMQVPEKYLQKYWGGQALSTRLIWDQIKKLEKDGKDIAKMDPFSPDNLLIIGTGPGTGIAGFPSPGRHHVMTLKSPLTGSIGSANTGGKFGAYLKRAGFDGIVIEGKAAKPVYLAGINGKLTIEDASTLWGLTCGQCDTKLKEMHEESGFNLSVACIGPAGEHLSPIASIINDAHRSAGRTGVGAVMGSKNLKAIIAGGAFKVEVADPNFKEVSAKLLKKMKENAVTGSGLPTYGTAILVNVLNNIGSLPQANWQRSYDERSDKIGGETLAKEYLRERVSCWGCSIGCGRGSKVESGPYKIDATEGPEYESLWSLGNDTSIYEMPPIIMANHLCDEYGLDTISMGSTIACAMEMAEKGFIPKGDLGNLDLKFGNGAALVESVKLAGKGEGFGKKLMLGSAKMSAMYGHPELSMSVKSLEMPAYDPRGVKGMGLNYATSNRGGCHVTGYTTSPEVLGLPQQIDRLAYEGKPTWVKVFQDFTCAVNSTVNCLFTTFALGVPDYAEMMSSVTGWKIKDTDVLLLGERTYNLQRLIMKKLGIEKKDTLPPRILNDPIPEGPSKGQTFKLDAMLQEYYKLRGWDSAGFPTPETIKKLELDL